MAGERFSVVGTTCAENFQRLWSQKLNQKAMKYVLKSGHPQWCHVLQTGPIQKHVKHNTFLNFTTFLLRPCVAKCININIFAWRNHWNRVWNTYEMHMKYIWNAYDLHTKCIWKHIKYIWNSYEIHLKYIWNTQSMHMTYTWNTNEIHRKYIWNAYSHTYEIHVEHIWNTYKIHMNAYDILMKRVWNTHMKYMWNAYGVGKLPDAVNSNDT